MISKAIVLCGGAGTRLRSVVADIPKVLAPINGRPFLDFLLRVLAKNGVMDVVLATGFKGDQVDDFIARLEPGRARITCLREKSPLGTGGAIANVVRKSGWKDPFFVLNGDTFFTGSFTFMDSCFNEGPWKARVAVVRRDDAGRFGRVLFDSKTHRVEEFTEKGESGAGWVNAGLYILRPELFEDVEPGVAVSLETGIFPTLINDQLLGVCTFDGDDFLDYGTPDAYLRAGRFLSRFGGVHD